MQTKKSLLAIFLPLFTIFAFGTAYFGFFPKNASALYPTLYPVSTLTGPNDFNFLLQVQAMGFENGKWTYHFTWKRTRNAQGTLAISPKVNEAFRVFELDPAPRESGSPLVVTLDPATRYVFNYYATPGCTQADTLTDPECIAIRSIYFNTRDANGKIMDTSEIPLSQGGTKVDTGGSGGNGNTIPSSLAGLSNNELVALVARLTAMVEQLILQMSNGSTVNVTSAGTGPGLNNNPTTVTGINGASPCPYMVGKILYGCFVNVFKSNPGTGLAYPVEPQFTEVFNKENPGPKTSDLASPSDPNNGTLILNTKSSPCWTGSSDIYATCDQTQKFKNGDYQEVWVYSTVGRKFISSFWGPKCDDASVKIEPSLNLPSGISYSARCEADSTVGAKIVLGKLSGSPSTAGVYKNEFKVTKTALDGSKNTYLTRIYFVVRPVGKIEVTITPAGAWADSTGKATPVSGGVKLGDRVGIFMNQRGPNGPNGTVWNSLDLWAVRGSHLGENPESDSNVANRIFIGTWEGDEGHLICNNSTSGGGDAYQYGCSSFNWLVGDTLSQNLTADSGGSTYTIFVTPHLPYIDRNNQYIARLYSNCEIGYKTCVNFAYGSAEVTIFPSSNTTLTTASQGVPVASFSQLSISATRDGVTSSIGPGGNDNGNVPGCGGGNESGGVTCAGPRTSTALKPGQSMNYSWSIKFGDKPGGNAWTSRIFVTNPNLNPNDLKPGGQMDRLRQCTSGIVPGGFDLNNEAQGFINDWTGSVTVSIPAGCADVLSGARVTQMVRVYVSLNGGGSTYATYLMGGLDITN